ncbi:MAG: aminotransferase class V-fold PLP-dependent enzyme, partial [Treponema sp.]|nr:aminotransferase class V-fold PLP-dependent enzyme [Treponema sp.]
VGRTPVDLSLWDADSAALSAHKLGGPRGAGILYLKKPVPVLYSGGGQEGGIRPGTENTEGAQVMAALLELRASPGAVLKEYGKASRRWNTLLDALRSMDRCSLIPQDRANGKAAPESPYTEPFSPYIVQAAFSGIPGEVMVRALDDLGFAVSTGSACSSSSPERPVLAAMGVAPGRILEGIRISQGWLTTGEDIEALAGAVREVLKFL